ncbi:MAG: ComF family protein [Selenomonadaceae bacterium]|nr:ComF family protein [Selenomonadaceae bacterium]
MNSRKAFGYIIDMVLDFFYPPRCPICERYIENRSDILCSECEENILSIDCSHDLRLQIKETWRLTKYKGGTQRIIWDIKFNKKLGELPTIKKILDKALNSNIKLKEMLQKIDLATAVPLHVNRERERGFNQVELIFGEWLNQQNIPMERLLLRIKDTEHLYDKKREERQREVDSAFELAEGAEVHIKGKRILILDDIFTTGTTMSECAKVLKTAGAVEVYGIALASDY